MRDWEEVGAGGETCAGDALQCPLSPWACLQNGWLDLKNFFSHARVPVLGLVLFVGFVFSWHLSVKF